MAYFYKIVSSVGPLMEKLTTGKIAEPISPDYMNEADNRPIFEWLDVIRRKGVVYVGLDALTDTTVASAVGDSIFADLVSVAGHIYKQGIAEPQAGPGQKGGAMPTISLHADAFNELIGDKFVPLLTRPGGRLPGHRLHPDLIGRRCAHRYPRQGGSRNWPPRRCSPTSYPRSRSSP